MCFNLTKDDNKAMLIATSDITCYKMMYEHIKGGYWFSLHQNFVYYKDKKYEKNSRLMETFSGRDGGNQGFHSYTPQNGNVAAKIRLFKKNTGYPYLIKLVECIIPEGSVFFYSEVNQQYFSNAIICVKEVTEIIEDELIIT